jgi:threonine dehydratase
MADIRSARDRIASGIRRTPCAPAPILSAIAGMGIVLKRDDLQRTGSFKERGARNALLRLDEARRARGVVAASAGNHALGLAYHGAQLGVRVTVVMPEGAPAVKVMRCRSLGAAVVQHGGSFEAAHAHALGLAGETGATPIHPFDDLDVIAGQGTMAVELFEQAEGFDTLVIPVGGGGLLAGAATVARALRPGVRIVAAQPERAAAFDEAWRNGAPSAVAVLPTLADGLAVGRVGDTSFALGAPLVDEVVRVTEDEIAAAVSLLARRAGIVAEGAGATALAAVLSGRVRGRSVALPICGRNIDPRVHEKVVEDGAARGGDALRRPGSEAGVCGAFGDEPGGGSGPGRWEVSRPGLQPGIRSAVYVAS